MTGVTAQVEAALTTVQDPCGQALGAGWTISDLGLLVDAEVLDGTWRVEITLTDPLCPFFEDLEARVSAAVLEHTEATAVEVQVSERVAWDPSRLQRPMWFGVNA